VFTDDAAEPSVVLAATDIGMDRVVRIRKLWATGIWCIESS